MRGPPRILRWFALILGISESLSKSWSHDFAICGVAQKSYQSHHQIDFQPQSSCVTQTTNMTPEIEIVGGHMTRQGPPPQWGKRI
jgi:hypothetical protein